MKVRCGRCGIELDEIASLCHQCGARLVTVNGSWYWQKGPKTGIQKHFEEDENGKREDIFGNVKPNPTEEVK